jgi:hypothetical protein
VNSREEANLPAGFRVIVNDPDSQEDMMANNGTDFDWNNKADVAVGQQDTIAVYSNDNGDLVIRRQKDWNEEDDTFVVAPAYVRQLIEAMERTFKEIQSR